MARVGRFELARELGSGGFGTVWEAVDSDSGQRVAVKLLDRMGASSDVVRAQLLAEADALRSVDSPNTLRVIDVVDDGQTLALVTDFVEGASLRSILDAHGTLSGRDALTVLYGAGLGLAAVHAAGLVHGDVKPANMLVEPDGTSKLIDFGLVSIPGWIAEDSLSPWGSPAYVPPEWVAHGYRDHRSDIYSLTVTLFEVLCGQRPFVADTVEEVRSKHVYEPLPDPRLFVGDLGDGLTQLLMWGLAKDPEERPQDVGTWLEYLAAAAEDKYGPSWFTAASVGSLAGGLLGAGVVASGVAVSGVGAGGAVVAGGGAAGVSGAAASTGAAATAASGASASTGAAGTGILSTVAGKVAVGAAVTALAAGGGVAAKVATDDPAPVVERVERIAFTRCDDNNVCTVYTISPDGSDEREIGLGYDPKWSPDGTKIAYWDDTESDPQVIVVNPDGSNRRTVAAGSEPTWSPNSTEIAFVGREDTDYPDRNISIVRVADGSLRKVDVRPYQLSSDLSEPRWSPDGKRLAFDIDSDPVASAIAKVGGGGAKEVKGDWVWVSASPWSPDGQRFVRLACLDTDDEDCHKWEIAAMSADGQEKRWAYTLDDGDGGLGIASWSPDGEHVVFGDERGGLVALNGEGENDKVIARPPGPDHSWGDDFAWAPSSRRFINVRWNGDNEELWIISADQAGKPRRLTVGTAPDWGLVPASLVAADQPSPGTQKTKVTVLRAVTERRVDPAFRIDESQSNSLVDVDMADAEYPSEFSMGPNTYSVGATADSADACWRGPNDEPVVYCMRDPWEKKLMRYSVTSIEDTPQADDPVPVGIELVNGCRYRNMSGGARSMSTDGWVPDMYPMDERPACADPPLAGENHRLIQKDGDTWFVHVGEVADGESVKRLRKVAVKEAIFIG